MIFFNENVFLENNFSLTGSLYEVYLTPQLEAFIENSNSAYKFFKKIRHCLSCSMNCKVIYMVFGAKPELQNYIFNYFLLEVNF